MPSLFFTILNMCAFYSHTGISLVSRPQKTDISYANIFSGWLSQCARFLFCGCLSLFYVAAFPQKYVSYWEFVQYCMYITVRVCISVYVRILCDDVFGGTLLHFCRDLNVRIEGGGIIKTNTLAHHRRFTYASKRRDKTSHTVTIWLYCKVVINAVNIYIIMWLLRETHTHIRKSF